MAYEMNLQGYLIGYRVELDHFISNGKGGRQKHIWKTLTVDFANADKEEQKILKISSQKLIATLNEKYVVLVAEKLDGLHQPSEKFGIGEYF